MNKKEGSSAPPGEEFRLSHEQIVALIDAIPDIVYLKDGTRRNRIINKAFVQAFGLKPEEIVGKLDEECLPADLAAACRESDDIVLRSGRPYWFEEKSVGPDGRERDFETVKAPVLDEDGRIAHLVGVSRDITERKAMEARLAESDARFRGLFDNMTIGLYRTTVDGRVVLANPAVVRMLGYDSFEELSRRNLAEDGFEPDHPRSDFQERIAREGEIKGLEGAWRRRDGTVIHVRESARLVKDASGKILYYEGTVEDVSERWRAETDQKNKQLALETALAEKNVLLKEIHHRVKNNMQVISSLLNLQSRHLKHPADVEIFKESQRRIRSMALIHEMLYRSRSLSQIEFGGYINKLMETLRGSLDNTHGRISYRNEIEEVSLDIQTAIPCGFIVNELVSNALKHAFPGDRRGEIFVGLRREPDDAIVLTVQDNGVGLPLGTDLKSFDSMGMQLVMLLVGQIEGTIRADRDRGTKFVLVFRELKYKSRL